MRIRYLMRLLPGIFHEGLIFGRIYDKIMKAEMIMKNRDAILSCGKSTLFPRHRLSGEMTGRIITLRNRKRIAILVGQAEEEYQNRFITGFLEKAFSDDMDVCVFSMYLKYQDTPERELGETNIYSLVNYDMFDAIVLMKDTIQTAGVVEVLEEDIHDHFSGPVISIEKTSEYFHSVCTDGYTPIVDIVSHLIEEHGFRDIAFLTGKRWHPHAQQRLEAYREAMEKHGLTVNEDRVVYGDFWYKSGEVCVEQLLEGGGLPEAIACANDQMAIGVCEELNRLGYLVPEDVAVVGFDSTVEGRTSPKPITSAIVAARDCGIYAEKYLVAKMNSDIKDEDYPPFQSKAELVVGMSCGCKEGTIHPRWDLRKEWETENSESGYFSINNSMADDLLKQTSLVEVLGTIYSYAFQIRDLESFHLCLQEPWRGLGENEIVHCANSGYTDRMIHAVRYNRNGAEGLVGLEEVFDTKELLPGLDDERDMPGVWYFVPFFYEDECFGYVVLDYGCRAQTYDSVFRLWIRDVSRGFEGVRRALALQVEELKRVAGQKALRTASDSVNVDLTDEEREEMSLVTKILDENLLTYHFQPIIRAKDGSIYSYEALMRSNTEQRVSPLAIIRYAGLMNRLGDVEMATFLNVLKIVDSNKKSLRNRKVFINSIPGVKLKAEVFSQVDGMLSANSESVVVELTEEAEIKDQDLEEMKNRYKELGIETAVDDYGTGYSNVSNLLRYMPDYVKIDRSLLSEIQDKPQKQYFVREIIDFCHENGIFALAEGVETTEELRMVIHLGVDLIQGYYTAKPSTEMITEIDEMVQREIKTYARERSEGLANRRYKAGRTNRVSLSTLIREGYTEIVVGEDNPVYRDVTIVGTPGMSSDIHLHVVPGFKGELTLENACLSHGKGHPSIELGDDSRLTLTLRGENVLKRGGILVPESSELVVEGTGNLTIRLDENEFFGIGNVSSKKCGQIIFEQDGEVCIETSGREGICIGSGLGGQIEIHSGKFRLDINSDTCVGIGSLSGDVNLDIHDCQVNVDMSAFKGVCVGSMDGSVEIITENASYQYELSGGEQVGIGSLNGKELKTDIWGTGLAATIRSERSTYIGALRGDSDVRLERVGARVESRGKEMRIFGGEGQNHIEMIGSEAIVKAQTDFPTDVVVNTDEFEITEAKCHFVVNGEEVDLSR